MNQTTIVAMKAVVSAIKAAKSEQKHGYALLKKRVTRIHADGIGMFNFDNGVYSIVSPTPDDTIITAQPFDADTGYWDGTSMSWDMSLFDKNEERKDGLFAASLNHDLSYEFAKEIADANNATVEDVHLWANRVLHIEQNHYAKVNIKAERSLVHWLLDKGGTLYSSIRKKMKGIPVALISAATIVGLQGCVSYDADERGTMVSDPIVWRFQNDGAIHTTKPVIECENSQGDGLSLLDSAASQSLGGGWEAGAPSGDGSAGDAAESDPGEKGD